MRDPSIEHYESFQDICRTCEWFIRSSRGNKLDFDKVEQERFNKHNIVDNFAEYVEQVVEIMQFNDWTMMEGGRYGPQQEVQENLMNFFLDFEETNYHTDSSEGRSYDGSDDDESDEERSDDGSDEESDDESDNDSTSSFVSGTVEWEEYDDSTVPPPIFTPSELNEIARQLTFE